MGFVVYSSQLLECGVRVYLCRVQALMPEEFSDAFDIRVVIEHCGGKGVPQYMRRAFLLVSDQCEMFSDESSQLVVCQAPLP